MAQDYSYNDLVRMQEQAIRRVRDMQERARLTMNGQEESSPVKDTAEEVVREEKEEKRSAEAVREAPRNPLGNLLNLDKDKAVILPLLLLLGKENSDNILLLALMYIMA